MTRGGAAPKIPPVGWVFVGPRQFSGSRHPEGVTIRWRRGDPVVHVLHGRRVGDHTTDDAVLATIPVPSAGWTDLADIRSLGIRWLRRQ